MLSSDVKWRATSIGIFVLPLVLVKLVAMILSAPMTATVTATNAVPAPDLALVEGMGWKPGWTTRQDKAASHVEMLDAAESFAPSPLFYHIVEDDPEVEVNEPKTIGAPSFVVGAILHSARGDVALINGRPYRKGDVVAGTGWVVIDIDGEARSVTMQDPETERTVTRIVRQGARNGQRHAIRPPR